MTREEALKRAKGYLTDYFSADCYREVEEIMEALEQNPCEDCISRQATVKRLCKLGDFMNEKRSGSGSPYITAALFIQDNKDEFPPVTPKEKTGKWVDDANKIDAQFGRHIYICSECGKYAEHFISGTEVWWDRIKPNFCPNCGTDMRGDTD